MVTCSSMHASKIPWTEDPGGPKSRESDTSEHAHTHPLKLSSSQLMTMQNSIGFIGGKAMFGFAFWAVCSSAGVWDVTSYIECIQWYLVLHLGIFLHMLWKRCIYVWLVWKKYERSMKVWKNGVWKKTRAVWCSLICPDRPWLPVDIISVY